MSPFMKATSPRITQHSTSQYTKTLSIRSTVCGVELVLWKEFMKELEWLCFKWLILLKMFEVG